MSDKKHPTPRSPYPAFAAGMSGLTDPPPPDMLTSQAEIAATSDREILVRGYNLQVWAAQKVIRLDGRMSDFFTTLMMFDVRLRELEAWKGEHADAYEKLKKRLEETIDISMRQKTITDKVVKAINESPAIKNVENTGTYSREELEGEMQKAAERLAEKQKYEAIAKENAELREQAKRRDSRFRWGTRKVVGPILGAVGAGILFLIASTISTCYQRMKANEGHTIVPTSVPALQEGQAHE